jgi:predicted ArsR family transcriptional regulator
MGTQDQIAKTFGCTEDNVRKHILNLLKDGGLERKVNFRKTF